MSQPAFWSDRARADELIKEFGVLSSVVNEFDKLESLLGSLEKNMEDQKFFDAKKMFRALELQELFKSPYDAGTAVVSVFPGAGGEDAEDWARMLGLMYENT